MEGKVDFKIEVWQEVLGYSGRVVYDGCVRYSNDIHNDLNKHWMEYGFSSKVATRMASRVCSSLSHQLNYTTNIQKDSNTACFRMTPKQAY